VSAASATGVVEQMLDHAANARWAGCVFVFDTAAMLALLS
jgi:hypothetical protein